MLWTLHLNWVGIIGKYRDIPSDMGTRDSRLSRSRHAQQRKNKSPKKNVSKNYIITHHLTWSPISH